jgi:hypothetical protein
VTGGTLFCMRLAVLALVCLSFACKSKPAEPAAAPPMPARGEIVQPMHPEVLRPRMSPRPDVAAPEGPGGILVAPPPAPNEQSVQARELFLRGYAMKDGNPTEATALFKQALGLLPPNDPLREKVNAQLKALAP